MSLIKYKNFSRDKISSAKVSDGDTFQNCNFSQEKPHTEIFTDIKNLTFIDCNLFNCDIPLGATRKGGLIVHKDCCSHLHPNWKLLTVCSDNCKHVIDSDEITVDGKLIDTIYHYEDIVL